ncbi:MAG: lipoate--protein ligase family protein [Chlorobiaceae bacterium]|nr:lipoate--protein ligase family protein [Chlorobiaceae bacterium]
MAFDLRLMQAFADGAVQREFGEECCLWRFYSWSPPAISLGCNQNPSEIDHARCRAEGVDVVVRPTGGRAVFHADELTYSFFAVTDLPNEAIYRMVHETIARALAGVGVTAEFCRSQPDFRARYATPESVSCFTASARYELQAGGRKLVGSAQRRQGKVLLQHGSLPLSWRHRQISRYLAGASRELVAAVDAGMAQKTASLDEFTVAGYADLVPLIVSAAGQSAAAGARMLAPDEVDQLGLANVSIT